MISIDTIADTIELFGHVVIAYTALSVHERVRKEHRITKEVYKEMRTERITAMFGIVLICSGYILKVYADYYVI